MHATSLAGRSLAEQVAASVITLGGDAPSAADVAVPAEVAVSLVFGAIPFAVMMATPDDLHDFAVGFSLTEGLIDGADEVRAVDVEPEGEGLRLRVSLVAPRLAALLARRRALTGRTGCGVCGVQDADHLPRATGMPAEPPWVPVAAVRRALASLEAHQTLHRVTRAVHAAAFADPEGGLLVLREDVGRHNALDKAIGALARQERNPAQGFFVVTSRCSYEMVEKVAIAGGGMLVAVSAPTSLALERARRHGMTLIAIARRDAITVFHGLQRLGPPCATADEAA